LDDSSSDENVTRERYLRGIDRIDERLDKYQKCIKSVNSTLVDLKKELVKLRGSLSANIDERKKIRQEIQQLKENKLDEHDLQLHRAECSKTDFTKSNLGEDGFVEKVRRVPKEHPYTTSGALAALLYALVELIRSLI